jgi:hypothetical protein
MPCVWAITLYAMPTMITVIATQGVFRLFRQAINLPNESVNLSRSSMAARMKTPNIPAQISVKAFIGVLSTRLVCIVPGYISHDAEQDE